ncbi:WbqC family protein [Solidesulfovibrio sp.]
MIIGILQPSYLPWLGYFEQIKQCDVFVLYDTVQYDKGGWRNRNRIKTPSGPLWLTVPVLLKNRNFPSIREVEINQTEAWARRHLKTLTQYYSNARHFADAFGDLERILLSGHRFLLDLNLEIIAWMNARLDIGTKIVLASDLAIDGDRESRIINIVKHLGGNTFYEGAAGRNYIDTGFFRQNGVDVVFQDYAHPVYPQLHGEFVSHLSAIDLLFNCGPNSATIFSDSCLNIRP